MNEAVRYAKGHEIRKIKIWRFSELALWNAFRLTGTMS